MKLSYSQKEISEAFMLINAITRDVNYSRLTGYVQWEAKQDLYRLKFRIEEALSNCPKFSPEDDWLREIEKEKIIKILSEK